MKGWREKQEGNRRGKGGCNESKERENKME